MKPLRRRGPKVRRAVRQGHELVQPSISSIQNENSEKIHEPGTSDTRQVDALDSLFPLHISKAVLEPIIRLYQQHSYSVWPVIDVDVLLDQLGDISLNDAEDVVDGTTCLAIALCAATMAQLHLNPVKNDSVVIDSTNMAQICLQLQPRYSNQSKDSDLIGILVSFFLHVYHAKVNRCTAAMMYVQEAISNAKKLHMNKGLWYLNEFEIGRETGIITNPSLIFPLLWVSER